MENQNRRPYLTGNKSVLDVCYTKYEALNRIRTRVNSHCDVAVGVMSASSRPLIDAQAEKERLNNSNRQWTSVWGSPMPRNFQSKRKYVFSTRIKLTKSLISTQFIRYRIYSICDRFSESYTQFLFAENVTKF